MEDSVREKILAKNQKLIDMVIQRAKRDFPDDIAIIGLTGSFSTGDYHEKSDLDLIIVNNTDRGWDIGYGFILGDVGYDVYCTPWETRIADQSRLESPMVSCLLDLQVLYCAKPEYMEKLQTYQQRARDELAKSVGRPCIDRAKKDISLAKQEYADAVLAEEIGSVRYAAGLVLYHLVNAVVSLNNTYINRGVKRYLEQLRTYRYLPERFEERYFAVIDAMTAEELRAAALALLRSVEKLRVEMEEQLIEKPVPTNESLRGTYEELWCNCRNKVLDSTAGGDKSYAFHTAIGAQNYLNEMAKEVGTPQFDLMKEFDSGDLSRFREAFLRSMDEYLGEYKKVGRRAERFDSFEALYEKYMRGNISAAGDAIPDERNGQQNV